jgi:hypothetical protein
MKNKIDEKTNGFEFIYSFLMLIMGFGILACFLALVAWLVHTFTIFVILLFLPIFAGIWSSIFKSNQESYEKKLKKKDGKRIMNIIKTICKHTGQKKPDKIIISEGSEVAVTGFFKKKVIIGMVALKFLNDKDLFAILSHEYGHFANKDTILGYLIYRIQHFIESQKEACYVGVRSWSISYVYLIQLAVYIPTYLFFWLFSRYFLLISLWYGRRVEFRADSFASKLVGEQNFANTLVKYCIIADIFEMLVPKYILHYLEQEKLIINIYDFIKPIYSKETIYYGFKTVLSNTSSWWSTHPSISERLEMLNIGKVDVDFDSNLKDILKNQEKYEEEASYIMTYKMDYWSRLMALAQQEAEEEE